MIVGFPHWPHNWNWDRIDAFLASFQRPYATFFLTTSIGVACWRPETAPIAIPAASAIVLAVIGARTVEKVRGVVGGQPQQKDGS